MTAQITWTYRRAAIYRAACALLVLCAVGSSIARADDDDKPDPAREEARRKYHSIQWTIGPATVSLGSIGEIKLSKKYQFTDSRGTNIWDELNHNPPDPTVLGMITPAEKLTWSIY